MILRNIYVAITPEFKLNLGEKWENMYPLPEFASPPLSLRISCNNFPHKNKL